MERIKNRIVFSEKEKEHIRNIYLRDYSSIEIGKIYGVSWRFILNKLKEWGVEIRKKHSFTNRRKNNLLKTIKQKQENGEDWGKGQLGNRMELDLEKINKMHWKDEKSIRDIAKEMGCSEFIIRFRLKEKGYKIRRPGIRTNRYAEKHRKLRKGKTVEEIYGKELGKKFRKQNKINRSNQVFPLKDSKPEIIAREFLDQLEIKYKQHSMINEIKYRYQCDFLIPKQKGINQKIILELDGDYWHANPEHNGNFMNYPAKIRANRIKDFERTSQLEEKGFKVLRLWEHEIKEMTLEDFKNKLNDLS